MTVPDVRPLSVDHVEIFSPTNVYSSLDHQVLPTQAGPARSPRILRRPSPYSSLDAERRRLNRSGSTSSFSSGLRSDTDTDLGPENSESPSRRSDRCVQAYASDWSIDPKTPTGTRQINCLVYAYDSDASIGCEDRGERRDALKKKHDLRVSADREQIPLFLPDVHESDSESGGIKKPPGEAGRPGRGGYTLRTSLAWSNKTYDKVKQFIDVLVEDKLDCNLSFGDQPLSNLQDVKDRAVARFPFLTNYRDLWVVDDFVRGHLKVWKAALRKSELEKIAADVRGPKAVEEHAKKAAKGDAKRRLRR